MHVVWWLLSLCVWSWVAPLQYKYTHVSFSSVRPFFFSFHNLSACFLKLPSLSLASRIDLLASFVFRFPSPWLSMSTPIYPLNFCPSDFWLSHPRFLRTLIILFFSTPSNTVTASLSFWRCSWFSLRLLHFPSCVFGLWNSAWLCAPSHAGASLICSSSWHFF